MTAPKSPQDFKKKVGQAVSLQAANLLQKAQLDMMATKIIMVLKEHRIWYMAADGKSMVRKTKADISTELETADKHLANIGRIVSMTREETSAARASFAYPDARIQAVIDKATDDIAAILLEDA